MGVRLSGGIEDRKEDRQHGPFMLPCIYLHTVGELWKVVSRINGLDLCYKKATGCRVEGGGQGRLVERCSAGRL